MPDRAAPMVAVLVLAGLLASACSGSDAAGPPTTLGGGAPPSSGPPSSDDDLASAVEIAAIADLDDAALAEQTYVAGYPLVVSMRTMQRLGGLLGVNRLFWQRELSGPATRVIVAPNRDTLYSVAVLDLRAEPQVLTLPEVTDRYYTYQFLDAWTESFDYVGTRATDGRAGTWVITAPGWTGDVPDGAEVIEATTPLVFLLGRYLVDDAADIANVTAISEQASLVPLSTHVGGAAPAPPPPLGEAAGTAQDIPRDARFFDELGDHLAAVGPVTEYQRALFTEAERLGIGAGLHPSDGEHAAVLDAAAAAGTARIATAAGNAETPVGGWSANLDVGTYGDDLDQRALVARIGWGANVPEEAVYPVARTDADGRALDGAATYRITFPGDALPPVDAFWSLTVYGADMFFAEHPSDRYSIGDRTPGLVRGDDGSIEITLSADEPADPSATNWLPVPRGPFVLMLRLYLPGAPLLDGTYPYPPIERVAAGD